MKTIARNVLLCIISLLHYVIVCEPACANRHRQNSENLFRYYYFNHDIRRLLRRWKILLFHFLFYKLTVNILWWNFLKGKNCLRLQHTKIMYTHEIFLTYKIIFTNTDEPKKKSLKVCVLTFIFPYFRIILLCSCPIFQGVWTIVVALYGNEAVLEIIFVVT